MRNERYRKNAISVRERHNERKNEVYSNPDVLLGYSKEIEKLYRKDPESLRGLKDDASAQQ